MPSLVEDTIDIETARLNAVIKSRAMDLVRDLEAKMSAKTGGHFGLGPTINKIVFGYFGVSEDEQTPKKRVNGARGSKSRRSA